MPHVLEVGDRIRVVHPAGIDGHRDVVGLEATVIGEAGDAVALEFDEEFPAGHDCGGRTSNRRGLYCYDFEEIERVTTPLTIDELPRTIHCSVCAAQIKCVSQEAYQDARCLYCSLARCARCADAHLATRHAYHEHGFTPHIVFLPAHNVGYRYFGVELEVEVDYDECYEGKRIGAGISALAKQHREAAVAALTPLSRRESLFWQSRDGSLLNGIEIASMPATLKYHATTMPWHEIEAVLKKCGCDADNAMTCGLHIHVSRHSFGVTEAGIAMNLAKLKQLSAILWPMLNRFSRRHTVSQFAAPLAGIQRIVTARGLLEYGQDARARYVAINTCPDNTVEFRFFQGTTRAAYVLAALRLVDAMTTLATTLPIGTVFRSYGMSECWRQLVAHASVRGPGSDEFKAYIKEFGLCV